MFETTLTVPTHHLPALISRFARAGFTMLDTGERIATDDGPDTEATIRLFDILTVEIVEPDTLEHGVRA